MAGAFSSPSRGMNRIAEILFDEFDWKLRSERPAQHGGSDTSGNRTPDRSGRNRIKDLLGIDALPLKHPDQLGDRVDLDPSSVFVVSFAREPAPIGPTCWMLEPRTFSTGAAADSALASPPMR